MNNKNKILLQVIPITLMIIVWFGCNSYKAKNIQDRIDTIKIDSSIADTVGNKYDADASLFELSRDYAIALDSLELLRDKVNHLNLKLVKVTASKDSSIKANIPVKEKLGVAEYKLLRIREYNRIAAQGNNLKFLRGWINRVINH